MRARTASWKWLQCRAGEFLCCGANHGQNTHQLRTRRLVMARPGLGRPVADADLMPEELRAAIGLFASLRDERERRLFAAANRSSGGGAAGGASRFSPASTRRPSGPGRPQLVERDVEVDRVRRAGGG